MARAIIFASPRRIKTRATGVCEINTPFVQVLALQSNSRNYYPAPDLMFLKPRLSRVFFSGGVSFSQMRATTLSTHRCRILKRRVICLAVFAKFALTWSLGSASSCVALSSWSHVASRYCVISLCPTSRKNDFIHHHHHHHHHHPEGVVYSV